MLTFNGRSWNMLSFITRAAATALGSENSTYAYLHIESALSYTGYFEVKKQQTPEAM